MDGFFTTDGIDCMGYYTGADLPFYYGLHRDFTLCVNYFCSVLGPSYPNHLYLAAGRPGASRRTTSRGSDCSTIPASSTCSTGAASRGRSTTSEALDDAARRPE